MKLVIILGILFLASAGPIHICTDHLHAVEDSIVSADAHITDLEDLEKETLDDIDSAFGDIRNSICKSDFVRTAHVIDLLRSKLMRIRQMKSKWVKVLQNTVNALPPHIKHKIIYKNKIENRMRINPDFISVADVPAIPVYEGMPKFAPVITKIADGVMEEIDDIKSDETLIKYQEDYDKLQYRSKQSHLRVQKVLEDIDAIIVSIRLGRMAKRDATENYEKMRNLLNKLVGDEKSYANQIKSLRLKIFKRKRSILEEVLKNGRVIQKDVIQNRIEFLRKMEEKLSSGKQTAINKRLENLVKVIEKQWEMLRDTNN